MASEEFADEDEEELPVPPGSVDVLAGITAAINSITPDMPHDEACMILCKMAYIAKRIKELRATMNAALIEWMATNKAELVIGTIRKYLGDKKKVKPKSALEFVKSMLELGGPTSVAECLSANFCKVGAFKKMVTELGSPELYEMLFTEETETVIKDGKAKTAKEIKTFDERFKR